MKKPNANSQWCSTSFFVVSWKFEFRTAMKDLENRPDVETLVNRFYEKVRADELISFFFTDIVAVDWPKHLPRMYDFWETILFGTQNFKGEPMTAHINLNRKHPMQEKHFGRWLSLFKKTVDENFSGAKAEEVKKRAESIAAIMMMKVKM